MDYKQINKSFKKNKVDKALKTKSGRHLYKTEELDKSYPNREGLVAEQRMDHQFLKKKPEKKLPPQHMLFEGVTRTSKRLKNKGLKNK
tara:strand:+ start:2617 stop:2880 length:264 start_codon:yes stop_codon:yes gene_type:complete